MLEDLKALKGKPVIIRLNDKGMYHSIQPDPEAPKEESKPAAPAPEQPKAEEKPKEPAGLAPATPPADVDETHRVSDEEMQHYQQMEAEQEAAELEKQKKAMEDAVKEKVAKRTPAPQRPEESNVEAPETNGEEEEDHPMGRIMAGMVDLSQKQEKLKDHMYFLKLRKTECKVAKLGHNNLNYISWAEAWDKLKEKYPDSRYQVHEDPKTHMPYFSDESGAFVKVSVTVSGLTHTTHLPVMNNRNQAVKKAELDTFIVNKNIQRCLAKAIAMHGVGLYVYQGEDFPEKE